MKKNKVLRSFQSGRDFDVYTNRLIIQTDTNGLTGKRVTLLSIPYNYTTGIEFETKGHMDTDAEVYCYTDIATVVKEKFLRIVPCLKTFAGQD